MKVALAILLSTLTLFKASAETRAVMTYSNSGVLYTPAGTSNLWIANSNGINAVVRHPEAVDVINLGNSVTNLLNQSTNVPAIFGGFTLTPVTNTDLYWWDFGVTNALGQKLIYATLQATNDVEFIGVTNCTKWGTLSFNVVASGADRLVRLPTGLPHLDTFGLTLTNGAYQLTLTNGNEFRMTIQSNSTLSTLWTTFGQ